VTDRFLVVNADDLGLCETVNEGIFAAHRDGIVTSASLMVRQAAAPVAAGRAGEFPRLAVGLHLDLGQWDYVNGEWIEAYSRCELASAAGVEAECRAQLDLFRSLLDRDPTHLDSHQHVHNSEPVAAIAAAIAAELRVPLRGRRVRYEGSFYGQDGKGEPYPDSIAPAGLVRLIRALPAGWTEIGCHPAAGPVPSSYDSERLAELATLRDSTVRAAISDAGVELRSFADF
jgi:chitin disaccharide deacetylase